MSILKSVLLKLWPSTHIQVIQPGGFPESQKVGSEEAVLSLTVASLGAPWELLLPLLPAPIYFWTHGQPHGPDDTIPCARSDQCADLVLSPRPSMQCRHSNLDSAYSTGSRSQTRHTWVNPAQGPSPGPICHIWPADQLHPTHLTCMLERLSFTTLNKRQESEGLSKTGGLKILYQRSKAGSTSVPLQSKQA